MHAPPCAGILFWDVTSLLLDATAFKYCIELFTARYKDMKIDVVAGAGAGVGQGGAGRATSGQTTGTRATGQLGA